MATLTEDASVRAKISQHPLNSKRELLRVGDLVTVRHERTTQQFIIRDRDQLSEIYDLGCYPIIVDVLRPSYEPVEVD